MADRARLYVRLVSETATTHAGGGYDLPTLWSRSYFVASVGAAMVRRHIDIQCERPWRKTKAARG